MFVIIQSLPLYDLPSDFSEGIYDFLVLLLCQTNTLKTHGNFGAAT